MRLPVVLLVGILLGAGVAGAEKVKTNQSTKLHSRAGEQSKVLLTVKSGQNMTLLDQDGRWLKVRVQGRTGYVPRSKVDMADDGGIARNTRRRPFVDGRSKRRGFGGSSSAPDDRIGADAVRDAEDEEEEEEEEAPKPKKAAVTKAAAAKPRVEAEEEEEEDRPAPRKPAAKSAPAKRGDGEEEDDEEDEEGDDEDTADEDEDEEGEDKGEPERQIARVGKKVSVLAEPDSESDEEFVARPTDVLYPIETKGEWTFVENDEGDGGWIQTDLLEVESEGGGGRGKRVIDVRARMGLAIIQQGMRTAGSSVLEVPDNYNIGTSSMTIAIGAGFLFPYGKKVVLGGEFTYDYAKTLFGGVFYDPDGPEAMPGADIGITLHNINVRGLIGYDLKNKSGMMLFGRLGYRYQGFLIADVANFMANPAKLPSEVVKAPTFGGAFAIPRLTDKIGIRFSLDAILFAASVKQTVGLEDGTSPTIKALTLGTGFTYRLKPSLDVTAAYDLNYMGIDFGPPRMGSLREHMGTNVARTDIFHIVTFGVAKPF